MECIFIEAMPVFRRVNPSGEAVEQADMIIFLQMPVSSSSSLIARLTDG